MKVLRALYSQFSSGLWTVPIIIFWAWNNYENGRNVELPLLLAAIYVVLYLIFRTVYRWKSSREK